MNQLQKYNPRAIDAPIDSNVRTLLGQEKIAAMLVRQLGKEEEARRLVLKVARLAFEDTQFARCHPVSIAGAVLAVAESRLELGTEVYLVPRWSKKYRSLALAAQTSYLGELARIRRATAGKVVPRVGIVREGDDFEYFPHEDKPIRHRVNLEAEEALAEGEERNVRGAWAVLIEDGVWHNPVYMTKREIDEHRDRYVEKTKDGKIPSNSLWNTAPEEAWKKTVIRKASKYVGRGGLLHEMEESQEPHEERLVEDLQPPARPDNGPEAAYAAVDVAEKILGTTEEGDTTQ